jgi:hypothetical protein
MDQNTKIILGIVLLGGAYYLYTRKKPEGDNLCYDRNGKIRNLTESERMQTVVRECYDKNGNSRKVKKENVGMNTSMPKSWILKNDFINGVIPNSNGTPNILFKKGDRIYGDSITKYFGKSVLGVEALPTVKGSYSETRNVFIPLENLTDITPQNLI